MLVPNEQLHWTRGRDHVVAWSKPGTDWHKWFCRTCGSPLPGPNDANQMFVPAGTITEGGDALRVVHHVWVGSKAPWDEIGDSGKQHAGRFEG